MSKPQSIKEPRHGGEGRHPRMRDVSATDVASNGNLILRPKKGNPTVQITPLEYDPTTQSAWVYILTNKPNGTLYVGVTTNLPLRVQQHQTGHADSFTKTHHIHQLVYFEGYAQITDAIARETAMKNWKREWKIRRIINTNPAWHNLTDRLI